MKNKTRPKLAANIQRHGWLVFNIGGGKMPFSYTVGLFETFGCPEMVVSGLPDDRAMSVLDDLGSDVAKGIVRKAEGVVR